MPELPTGTVTFLFTDIEGSTQLWEHQPEAMKAALARHDAVLRQVIESQRGQIIKTTGDGVHAVFASAADGLSAVLAGQRALQAETWNGTSPIKVRMALHTGEAELRGNDYYGPALNRAARLMSVASGGQILVSATTADLVRDNLGEGVTLRDLGEHRLRDLIRPERIFQAVALDLLADFPPLKSLDSFPNNLPVQLTSFVGREREIFEAKRLLAGTRLLTLTGPGGTGKTRLSLQVAADVLPDFSDGVWLVELAPLSDPALITQTIAATLGVQEQSGRPLLATLIDYLSLKHLLVILDNCEHLIEICSQLADRLLKACPRLKIIASSREALGLAGEVAYRVPSLTLPDVHNVTPVTLTRCEAAQLFLERAMAAQPHFAATEQNAPAIAQICRRLDGIPLAIELAAARARMFSVEQIASRLDDRFRLLTGGSRTALPRQQTLRALIDWSYDILPEPERAALRQLSVFAGGWTFEAAEAVIGAETLESLSQLIDKSLVTTDDHQGETRYRLLETVRQYAREKLLEASESETARERHLGFFLKLAEIAEIKLQGPEMVWWLDRLEIEQDNLRAALEWALEKEPLAALRLVTALTVFWGRRAASTTEGRNWVRAALARAETLPQIEGETAGPYLAIRARVLATESTLAFGQGENLAAQAAAEISIALARQIDAPRTLAWVLGIGGMASAMLGDSTTARAWGEESIAICRRHGYIYELGIALSSQTMLAFFTNDPLQEAAQAEGLRVARELGNPWVMAMSVYNAAQFAAIKGKLTEAYAHFEEAAARYKQMRDRHFYTACRSEQGHMLRQQGRFGEALALYHETIPVWQETGYRAAAAHELECFGFIARAQSQAHRAARLLGAAESLRDNVNSPMTPVEHVEYEREVSALRTQLSGTAFEAEWAEGRAMTMGQAIEYALQTGP